MSNLAVLLDETERKDEAEPLFREVLEVRRKVLGVEHPDTIESMSNLALLLEEQAAAAHASGSHQDAARMLREGAENC